MAIITNQKGFKMLSSTHFKNHSINALSEFNRMRLGDIRLDKRCIKIVEKIQSSPDKSFPNIFKDPGQLKAAYRFISSKNVDAEKIINPHHKLTFNRSAKCPLVLVLHDTTDFKFSPAFVEGLGVIDPGNRSGFYAHLSFCIDGSGQPLGIARCYAWCRTGTVKGKVSQSISQYTPDRESLRWNDAVHDVDDAIKTACETGATSPTVVHVMDREADNIELLADMVENNRFFVVRGKNNRRLESGRTTTDKKLFDEVSKANIISTKKVNVVSHHSLGSACDKIVNPKRKGGRQRKQQKKWIETRIAELEIRAMNCTIYAGNGGHAHVPGEGLKVGVVHVQEVNVPEDVKPLCWYIITNLPIENNEQIESIVDIYKHRWLIEEYIKAIKTGCAYQSHQFDHGDDFIRALMIYIPMAFQMLRVRWWDRFRPEVDAKEILEEEQLHALRAYRQRQGKPLSKNPTVKEVLMIIAILGGHLPANGPPGWLILSRGFSFLNDITLGWQAARDWFQSTSFEQVGEPFGDPDGS